MNYCVYKYTESMFQKNAVLSSKNSILDNEDKVTIPVKFMYNYLVFSGSCVSAFTGSLGLFSVSLGLLSASLGFS